MRSSAARAEILLVHDEPPLARPLVEELSRRGFAVKVAASSEEALLLCARYPIPVVIAELRLSRLDGIALLERLKASRSEARLFLMGSELDVRTTVRAVRAGAEDVFETSLCAAAISERLSKLIDAAASPPLPQRPSATSSILGDAPSIQAVREQVRTVARYRDLPVLITGETGTGKELVAQAIHASSESDGPFVPVNCAAIPEQLFESELFGHEAGSFTGARSAHAGLFESAGAGSLFLDEIGELPGALQPKLLRALETRSFRRVGGTRDLPFRARVISATHRSLSNPGDSFRSDLYYRLAGFTIATPALRDRSSDLDVLARHFLSDFGQRYGVWLDVSPRALEALHAYDWPGNVRELRAVLQQAAVLAPGNCVGVAELAAALRDRKQGATSRSALTPVVERRPASLPPIRRSEPCEPLRITEQRTILKTWESSGKNLSAAARKLGLPRNTLRDRLRRYGAL